MKKRILFAGLTLLITGCTGAGIGKVVKFKTPDIKNDFCGVHINFQYCKCAFHGQLCDAIGLKKGEANSKVQKEFKDWLATQLAAFADSCTSAGGIFKKDACQYCKEGYVVQGNSCVQTGAAEESNANTNNQPAVADGPVADDCSLRQDVFDRDWKKYSDIDEVIPYEERSFEAKKALDVYETMVSKMLEGFQLERDVEIEKQMQAGLETYRNALVNNIKTNLLKSFWRLSWVTYTTIKSGSSLGETYSDLLDVEDAVEGIGKGLKLIQGVVPNDSSLAIDTSTVTGKVKSVGASVALEAIDSLGDPVKVATTLFESASNAPLPSADITPEEVEILRTQHLKKGVIDEVLAKSKAANVAREARMAALETEIAALKQEVGQWEVKEKDRVAVELVESCKELKKE